MWHLLSNAQLHKLYHCMIPLSISISETWVSLNVRKEKSYKALLAWTTAWNTYIRLLNESALEVEALEEAVCEGYTGRMSIEKALKPLQTGAPLSPSVSVARCFTLWPDSHALSPNLSPSGPKCSLPHVVHSGLPSSQSHHGLCF